MENLGLSTQEVTSSSLVPPTTAYQIQKAIPAEDFVEESGCDIV